MSRIRSVHPGIYTDEAWASVCIEARWLGIGLLTEADDRGIFEWKTLQIKMRLFPADNIDVGELLESLLTADIIRKFNVSGRTYGAIKNFCRYQRPRKPQLKHPSSDDIDTFVDLNARRVPQKSEPDDDEQGPIPPRSEKSPQMEEGGGSRNKKQEELPSEVPANKPNDDARQAVEIYNESAGRTGWPRVQRLTPQRRAACNARLSECGGIDGWRTAIAKGAASSFLCGSNQTGWKADFDFFCQSKSFTKLMEGSYDDRTPGEGHGGNGETVRRSIARVLEERSRMGVGQAGTDGREEPGPDAPPPSGGMGDDIEIPSMLRRY